MMFSAQDLRRLILPLVVEQVLLVTVGMADTVMVSSVGQEAISAISLVMNYVLSKWFIFKKS